MFQKMLVVDATERIAGFHIVLQAMQDFWVKKTPPKTSLGNGRHCIN